MLCERCHEKEAAVRITKIVNGETETHFFCTVCAQEMGFGEKHGNEEIWQQAIMRLISDALTKKRDSNTPNPGSEKMRLKKCRNCGKTFGEFLDTSLLGCSECYESFDSLLSSMIKKLQGASVHTGKQSIDNKEEKETETFASMEEEITEAEKLEALKFKLTEAVSLENFEEAARLRDEIKALKEGLYDK